ncbi:unnamed protein product [Cylindrotheca closterium]|uniref:Chorein N-terminal domain-containing protein n=1 Tax=Cylindrotheca closterium TaxID=2856 RepID=A0AAD2FC33_9STRA|nr:unnamed protein product [Cylindrotheca closterium]
MAKQALQRVLEDTIGKYVRGLDAESLNVAIWSGKIALNSVELNVDAVNLELDRQAEEAPNLALPFKVVSGGFTSFHVEVPWSHLASSPVILRLSGLSIIVEPYKRDTQAGNKNVSVAQATKQRQRSVKSANEYREQANNVKKLAGADSDASSQSTFVSRLVRRIIENIQVEISDVHISLAGKEGSAGVVLESLALVTTDKSGKRTFVDRTASYNSSIFLHKALELKGFGVYVDESIHGEPQSHSYILAPLAFQANLRQADGNICVDHSKYQLSSELSTISIEVSRNQLDVVEKVSQGMAMQEIGANPLFPEYRPIARVSSENAHEWWKYAKRCIGRMSGRSSWAEFFLAFKKRKTYIRLYKRHIHSGRCSWIEPLSENEKSEMTEIENDRTISVNGLMFWRDLADGQVDLEQSKQTKKEKGKRKKGVLFSSKRQEDNGDSPVKLTIEELKDLEDMWQEGFADDELSKDSRLCDASFILKSLNVVLTSYQSRQIAALNMGEVDLGFNARADGAFAFNFDMLDLKIQDLATSDSLFPDVLRSLPKDDAMAIEEKNGAVHLQIAKSKTGDQSLQLIIAAFEAVASPTFFKELMIFVTPTSSTTTERVDSTSLKLASESVDDFSNALVDAWAAKTESKVSWAMDVDIDAPIIIVPETCDDRSANIVVLDLGQFHLNFGKFSPTKQVQQWFQDNKADHKADVSYESGFLCTSDFSLKVGTASDWLEESSFAGASSGSFIIEPISETVDDFDIEQSHHALDPPQICCIGVIGRAMLSPMQTFRRANVTVLDLGQRQLHYGRFTPATKVKPWIQDTKAEHQSGVLYESGSLCTIIEPISAKLDFGIEQSHNALDPPRICFIGVVPSVSFRFSPTQGKKLFPVVKAWGNFSNEINSELEGPLLTSAPHPTADDGLETQSISKTESGTAIHDQSLEDQSKTDEEYLATVFFKIRLQRLSTTLSLDENNRLEAHLVSVYATTVVRSNGSSSTSLQMGWFWVLDLLESDIKRKQRLLAHSVLTKDPSSFAEGDKYDILGHLVEQGVFEEDYAGSTDLADISYDQLVSEYGKSRMETRVDQLLDMKFCSLFIHWNPKGLEGVLSMIESFRSILGDNDTINHETVVEALSQNISSPSDDAKEEGDSATEGKLLIKLKAESLDICLRSPRDDLPLFTLEATDGDMSLISDQNELSCHVTLKSMTAEDVRPEASHRQYRRIIDQETGTSATSSGDAHLFVIDYTAGLDFTRTGLVIGSPQIILIPDAVSELVTFFQVEDGMKQGPNSSLAGLDDENGKKDNVDGTESIVSNEAGDIEVPDGTASDRTYRYTYAVKTQVCSIVLVDLGSELSSERKTNATQPSHMAETVVLRGIFDVTVAMDTDPETFETINAEVQMQAEAMQIFSALGKEMLSPMQILAPTQGSVYISMRTNADESTAIELRAAAITDLEVFLSMHQAAMLSAIVESLSSSFEVNETNIDESQIQELSANETEWIEQLSSVLDQTDSNGPIRSHSRSVSAVGIDESAPFQLQSNVEMKIAQKIQTKITMPQFRVTVVNDLLGLDEALFRVSVAKFVAHGEVSVPIGPNAMQNMVVDFQMSTSILADYFDSSINLWSSLLIKPWEVSLKLSRASTRRFKSPRLSSTIDLESFPCHLSLSPEFLVSLASATRMWSVYSIATSKSPITDSEKRNTNDENAKASMAASAARNLLTSLPYAIENHCGCDVIFSLPHGRIKQRECPTGSIKYFRFQPPQGRGHGGRRAYGQDVEFEKSVTLSIGDREIVIPHLDGMLGARKDVHNLSDGRVLVTYVIREDKTMVLHLTSNVSVVNHSSIPFAISVGMIDPKSIGTCIAHNEEKENTALTEINGVATEPSNRFSVPMNLLNSGHSPVFLRLSPNLKSDTTQVLSGGLDVASQFRKLSKSGRVCRVDLTCYANSGGSKSMDPFVVQVLLKGTLIDDKTMNIDVFLEPRAVIENLFPIDISIRSKMPHTFSLSARDSNDGDHRLKPGNRVEVFTRGDALAIAIKPTHKPSAGSSLEWMDLELPLKSEFRLAEPMSCLFRFAESKKRNSEFFIAEGYEGLDQLSEVMADEAPKKLGSKSSLRTVSLEDPLRLFHVTVCCYGVDHTGEILFELLESKKEQKQKQKQYHPFGAFPSGKDSIRLTMLPRSNAMLRLLRVSSSSEAGYKATLPFTMDDLVIGEGGLNALPILWENKKSSGYCAYRRLVNEHQSEVHIVPEFVVFNGSAESVIVSERGMDDVTVDAGSFVPLKCVSRTVGLELALNYVNEECKTRYIRVDQLGVKVELVQSTVGTPVGSVCVQTALDTYGNARLVVKIGEITAGAKMANAPSILPAFLADDFIRFRVRWSELQLVLNKSREKQRAEGLPAQGLSSSPRTDTKGPKSVESDSVMSVNISRFSVDVQRVFKKQEDGDHKIEASSMPSPERCQMSMSIHQLQVKDLTPNSLFPIVFDSSSDANFIGLSARTRGPMDGDIVNVDLFDLSLAHTKGKSEMIQLTTSEEFVWRIVDMMTRISEASSEVGDYSLVLKEDVDHGGYIVEIKDGVNESDDTVLYAAPYVDQLFNVDLARVSPFVLLVSFNRTPDESRYAMARNVRGAALTNYFTRKLKFSIDRAKLKFGKYENRTLKGPTDRILESLGAVYVGRMKFKVLTLLSSASLQDWKFLAARGGDDEYVDGDELRATGNIAGMAAGAFLGTIGRGLGSGVSNVTRTLGNGIEGATGLVGARKLGAGVNTVISGVGGGVGNTLTGVSGGAGKVLQGAGQGVGQVVGGVLGGAFQMGKGIGVGIVKGDGKGLVNSIGKGAGQIGGGVVKGTGSILKGATDGVITTGKGVFQVGKKSPGKKSRKKHVDASDDKKNHDEKMTEQQVNASDDSKKPDKKWKKPHLKVPAMAKRNQTR